MSPILTSHVLNLAEDAWNRTNGGFWETSSAFRPWWSTEVFIWTATWNCSSPCPGFPWTIALRWGTCITALWAPLFFYAPPQHPLCISLLSLHNEIRKECWPVSNTIYTDYFINEVPEFLLNGKKWQSDLATLYPKEFFEQPAFIRSRGFSIHHCCGSWMPGKSHSFILNQAFCHQVKWLKRKMQYGPGSPQERVLSLLPCRSEGRFPEKEL